MDSFFSFFCFTHILTITLLSILTLVMIFIGIINYWQVYRESARLFDTELAASASVLNTIVENKLTIDTYHDEFLFQVFNVRTGQILFKSDDAPIEPITEKDRGYDTYKNHTQSWRTFSLFNPKENIRIIVAMKKDFSFEFQMDVFIHDLQTLVLVYLMIGIAIYLVIQKGLKALNHTVNEISKRNGENLSAIDIGKVPLELRPVIQEINRLFSRVDESFAREKRFTADAAHELRTPLAALKTQVEIAKKELDKTKRIEILNKIIEGTNRCSHVVDQLLALSRLEPEALALSKLDSIDLVAIAESLIVNIIPLAIEKDIELELIAPSHPVFIMGKVPAIEILLRNLIANSINYTPHGGQIQVIVSQQQEDSDIVLQVIDNGIGVPEEFHERIFDRFFRQLGNKQPGSGLGLSIVTQVVRLHHGRIRAKTPANGKGLEIEVTFPSTK
jgi:two-component system sensor histidine kinase QseC